MTVLITLTTAGTDSGPFDLYSDLDGYLAAFESGVSKASLEAGYASSLVPDYTNIIRVKSNGVFCTNSVNIFVGSTTTTSTTTTVIPPWNSLTALRETCALSENPDINISTACVFGPENMQIATFYVATQNPTYLTIGDRVFTENLPGITTFNGADIENNPLYWGIVLTFGVEICPMAANRIAKIDNQGFIVDLQCCEVTP